MGINTEMLRNINEKCYRFFETCKLFVEAAKDVPKWMPAFVHEDPRIKNVESLEEFQKTKKIPVNDFVEDFTFQNMEMLTSAQNSFTLAKSEILQYLRNSIRNKLKNTSVPEDIKEKIRLFSQSLENRANFGEDLSINKTLQIGDDFILEKNRKLPYILEYMEAQLGISTKPLFDNELKEFERTLKQIKHIEKQKTVYKVVFSTKPADIMGMSSRSEWTSCQNLFSDYDYKLKAVDSGLSPYIGIIYLTKDKDFIDRGEEMLARSLVIYTENDSGEAKLFLGPIYTNFSKKEEIINVFKNVLTKRSSLSVGLYNDKDQEYHIPTKKEEEIPYIDEGSFLKEKTISNVINNPETTEEDLLKLIKIHSNISLKNWLALINRVNSQKVIGYILTKVDGANLSISDSPAIVAALLKCKDETILDDYSYAHDPEILKAVCKSTKDKKILNKLLRSDDKAVKEAARNRMNHLGYQINETVDEDDWDELPA